MKKTSIQLYTELKHIVKSLWKLLRLNKLEKTKGRKLALSPIEIISLALFKQLNGIPTKKAAFNIFRPKCSYKTLVININRFAKWALLILVQLLKINQKQAHLVKHTDSTDIPVCLNKNAKHHKTMQGLANWGHSGKGWFYGVKLHITTDLERRLLSVRFTSGNVHDSQVFIPLNEGLTGVFLGDAAYISEKLAKEFYQEGKRILFAKPKKNMKKLITGWQYYLYKTRTIIELNFRSLKQFHNLVTSLPRSVNGYLANYIYSLLSYLIA